METIVVWLLYVVLIHSNGDVTSYSQTTENRRICMQGKSESHLRADELVRKNRFSGTRSAAPAWK